MKSRVCLILEGTYPYVTGGVSSWTQQLIEGLDDFEFHIVHIEAIQKEKRELVYKMPSNVIGIEHHHLFAEELLNAEPASISVELLRSWAWLTAEHEKIGGQTSFIDFFYQKYALRSPIMRISQMMVPEADIYHSPSTGYAGLLASHIAEKRGKPLIITEHGIYAREREIELNDVKWLPQERQEYHMVNETAVKLRDLWTSHFHKMSKQAYDTATAVVTLFNGNRKAQIEDGLDYMKSYVIPNGVSERFKGLRQTNPPWTNPSPSEPFRVCFIGRVVAIKDVKTAIKAVFIARKQFPNITLSIAGPLLEEPRYVEQCRELTKYLELDDAVAFRGLQDSTKVIEESDAMILSSISEGLPLVVLEAMYAGLPVVSTRVGACEELLLGRPEMEDALGAAGILTDIGDDEGLALALVRLAENPALWSRMAAVGPKRAEQFYKQKDVIQRYRDLYHSVSKGDGSGQEWRA